MCAYVVKFIENLLEILLHYNFYFFVYNLYHLIQATPYTINGLMFVDSRIIPARIQRIQPVHAHTHPSTSYGLVVLHLAPLYA